MNYNSLIKCGGVNMPNFDGTGPRGLGPMTGRGLGPCGRGYRRGYGFGRFYGFGRSLTKSEEKKLLEEELKEIDRIKKEIEERLKDLEKN